MGNCHGCDHVRSAVAASKMASGQAASGYLGDPSSGSIGNVNNDAFGGSEGESRDLVSETHP